MNRTNPLVSVIMCTYNGSAFIDEQIESIINQDYKNIELVIVDDCSTDDTFEKIKHWSDKYSFISFSQNEINLGYNKNFEKAIQRAKGDFITISDQDDIWLAQKISDSLACYSEMNVSLVHCQNISLKDGKLRHKLAKARIPMEGNDIRQLFLYGQISGHTMLFKRDLLEKIFPMPQGILYDLWISAIACCHGNIKSVNKALVYHRVHGKNFSLDKKSPSKKLELDLHETLEALSTIDSMNLKHKSFLLHFLDLIQNHNSKKTGTFDKEVFLFLIKNRQLFFGHRKRLIPIISHVKHSIKLSKMNFIGRGKL